MPGIWFMISIGVWITVAAIVYKYAQWTNYLNQGLTTVRIRYEKKIFVDKVYELLSTKKISYEERGISSDGFEIVKFTYPEEDWGPGNGLCANQPLVWDVGAKLQNSLARSNRSRFG